MSNQGECAQTMELRMASVPSPNSPQASYDVRFRVILVSIDQAHIIFFNLYNGSGAAHKYVQHIVFYL